MSEQVKSCEINEQPANEQPRMLLNKDALVDPDSQTFDEIVRYFDDKLRNNGETLYQLGDNETGNGLTNEELAKSVATLNRICEKLNADPRQLSSSMNKNDQKHTATFMIRKNEEKNDFQEIRVAVLGNVDAGKSTILAVLTHGQLDDGRGKARQKLFRHKHEIESGRTSSVGNDILGYDSKGDIVNKPTAHNSNLNWTEICEKSSKLISFIDLAGHSRYLKTTIFGITGYLPNYSMLIIGGNSGGVIGSTKEHLGLALCMKLPVFVVVTKIDSTPSNVLKNTLDALHKILKSSGCRKMPIAIKTEHDVILASNNFATSKLCPVFQVSCVSGENLDLLKMFLNLLSYKNEPIDEPCEFQINDTFNSPHVGCVVAGIVRKGVIRTNDVLYLGPNKMNQFEQVTIKSIHRKRMPVREARSGQSASFALKKVKRHEVRKGMVLLSRTLEPRAYQDFYAEILVLHHPTTICKNYQAVVHCGSIRQTATIINMDK